MYTGFRTHSGLNLCRLKRAIVVKFSIGRGIVGIEYMVHIIGENMGFFFLEVSCLVFLFALPII